MTSLTTGLKNSNYQGGNEKKEEKKEEEYESSGTWNLSRKAAAKRRTKFQNNEVATFIDLETVAFRDGTDFSQVVRKLDALVAERMSGSVKLEEWQHFCAEQVTAYMLRNDENEELKKKLKNTRMVVKCYLQRKAYCDPACKPMDSPRKSELLEIKMAEDIVDCALDIRSQNQQRGICIISK